MIRLEKCSPISPDWPTSRWAVNEVVRDQYAFQVSPHLPAGSYQLMLSLQNADGNRTDQLVLISPLTVKPLPRAFITPNPQVITNLKLGDAIGLIGYDLIVTDIIRLTLYWQAYEPIDRSCK
jgi:hypothetical protein